MTQDTMIETIAARFAIADVIHGYARAIRTDRPEDAAGLFTPDGWFEIREGLPDREPFTLRKRLGSRDEVLAHLLPGKGKPHPIPLIHNLIIEVTGDTAAANSVMAAEVFGTAHKVIGEYHDTFRREDGTWWFTSRIYKVFKAE